MKELKLDIFRSQKAYEQFFHTHYDLLCKFAYTYLKDVEQSADVVQNSFVKLWESKDTLKIETSVKSYLYAVVRNTCLNELKHNKIKDSYKSHILSTSSSSSDLLEEIEANELKVKINLAIENMPEQRRKIFTMSRINGLKYSEIAEKLELSPKTVANHMGLAIKFLRKELEDYLQILLLYFFIEGLGNYII